jgi:hypothetical protein
LKADGNAGAATKIMSDSLIPFQPAMDEPSNILPSLKKALIHQAAWDGDVLLLTNGIGKAQVSEFGVFFRNPF